MAEKFSIKTIAEWVQTEEDADYLRQWGVDYLQGNHFGSASMALPWETPGAALMPARIEPAGTVVLEEPPLSEPMTVDVAAEQPSFERDLGRDIPNVSRLQAALATLDKTFGRPTA